MVNIKMIDAKEHYKICCYFRDTIEKLKSVKPKDQKLIDYYLEYSKYHYKRYYELTKTTT